MLNVPLALQPYNDMWLDCVKNNLMSILIAYNKSFMSLPLTFKAQYWKKTISQKFSSEEAYRSMLDQGLFLPKVEYTSDELYSFFDIQKGIIEPSELHGLHKLIKETLHNQQHVFLTIDRFFYATGRESGQIHFEHPVFIHGYSDVENCYLAYEDCLTPGNFQPYHVPYDVIDSSTTYYVENMKKIEVSTVRVDSEKVRNHSFDITEDSLLQVLNYAKIDEIKYNEEFDLYYQIGISCLEQYADESDLILSNITDESIFALRTQSFVQNHKKNNLLIQHFYSNGKFDHDQLSELMELIKDASIKWEKYKASFLKKLQTNNVIDLSKQKESLMRIVEVERKIAAFNL